MTIRIAYGDGRPFDLMRAECNQSREMAVARLDSHGWRAAPVAGNRVSFARSVSS